MSLSIYNKFAKGFKNNSSGTQMTWWKTNFNMPVPNIFDDNSNYQKDTWMLTALEEWTTFDLTWFRQWWEVIAASSVFTIDWPYSNWTINLYQTWYKPDWTKMFTNWPYSWNPWNVDSWYWISYQIVSNQWVAPWEVDVDWDYTCKVYTTWWIEQESNFNVTLNNVPEFTWYNTNWNLWVEWEQLCYTWDNWFVHKMDWAIINSDATEAGYIYTDTDVDNRLVYSTEWWNTRTPLRNIKQFASSFSNWAPWEVSWKQPWYLYADAEFWHTHLSHIAWDWYKYLIWDWHDPYQDPY